MHVSEIYLCNFLAGLKVHIGPFHMNSVSSKNPKYLINELTKAIEFNKIYYRNVIQNEKYGNFVDFKIRIEMRKRYYKV